MNQFGLGNFINKFINSSLLASGGKNPNGVSQDVGVGTEFKLPPEPLGQGLAQNAGTFARGLGGYNGLMLTNLKMNHIESLERGLYIKDLMNLPKEMQEVLILVQSKMATGEELTKLLTTNINLSTLAELIKNGGKEAMNKLVMVMAEASKQGISDTSQIKDAIKLINASVSVASQENPSQILKSFMLLYLPWLPLQEGVDFELEIESSEGGDEESETIITILISTRNYGNVRVTLILPERNSLNIIINCTEAFPKEELLKRLNTESKSHAIQSNIIFEQIPAKQSNEEKPATNVLNQAKVHFSNPKEVNPFLLIMANAVIRHTIELDNLAG